MQATDRNEPSSSIVIDDKTALIVIDMQKDFTVGSFAQPCWAAGGGSLTALPVIETQAGDARDRKSVV